MFLRLITTAILSANLISAALAEPIQRPTIQDAQQSCLRVAVESGQDKASPLGVRAVCALDAAPISITPDSVPLPGPTGVNGQPEIDDTLVPCKDAAGTVDPSCWMK
jgi:hypothetical protein